MAGLHGGVLLLRRYRARARLMADPAADRAALRLVLARVRARARLSPTRTRTRGLGRA